jgi:hypothetical protein
MVSPEGRWDGPGPGRCGTAAPGAPAHPPAAGVMAPEPRPQPGQGHGGWSAASFPSAGRDRGMPTLWPWSLNGQARRPTPLAGPPGRGRHLRRLRALWTPAPQPRGGVGRYLPGAHPGLALLADLPHPQLAPPLAALLFGVAVVGAMHCPEPVAWRGSWQRRTAVVTGSRPARATGRPRTRAAPPPTCTAKGSETPSKC